MARLLSGLSLFLFYCSAYAQTAAANPPEETASTTAVIIFVVLFVGSCVGFIWMVYSAERKKKATQAGKSEATKDDAKKDEAK